MDTSGFQRWLLSIKGLKLATCQSRISNCLKVEKAEGDLDELYKHDRLNDLVSRLSYTTDDERNARPPRHQVPLAGNVRRGSATLKSAVVLYRDFKDSQYLDVLFVSSMNDSAADYGLQLLHGETFLKRFAAQLELLHSDPLFMLLCHEAERRAGEGATTLQLKEAARVVFNEYEPERRFDEVRHIVDSLTGSGHMKDTAYTSIFFSMKILDLARR